MRCCINCVCNFLSDSLKYVSIYVLTIAIKIRRLKHILVYQIPLGSNLIYVNLLTMALAIKVAIRMNRG